MSACTSNSGNSGSGNGRPTTRNSPTYPAAGPRSQAVLNYGYGAVASGPRYQSDVVVVSGGPSAIRSASADGLTWTIDRNAGGASSLQVGKVMLLTSRAAGRVVEVHDSGDSRVVKLAPVDLPEVVRDADIHIDQDVDIGAVTYQQIPALPWALSEPAPGDPSSAGGGQTPAAGATPSKFTAGSAVANFGRPTLTIEHAARPRAARSTLDPDLPAAGKAGVEIPVGNWSVAPSVEADKLGLGISYKAGESLKAGVDLAFTTDNLHINGLDRIVGGSRTDTSFTITGITGLEIAFQAGAANGSLDNSKVKIEVPVEADIPIPPSPATAGLPMNIKIEFKVIVETALTGKNSTLLASGQYKLDGPFGYAGGKLTAPKFTVEKSIIDSISGITLGPSGIVAAMSVKFMLGLGTPALTAGPYAELTAAVGVTNGSSLGAALARCHGATLDLDGAGGAGIAVSSDILPILNKIFPTAATFKLSIEKKVSLLHRAQTVPDVPLCRA